jgi:hypothetical protein
MTEELKQTAKEEIEKLPVEIAKAITSFDWEKVAEEIGKKYYLFDENINALQAEILMVLAGIEDPAYFQIHIENNAILTKEESELITQEVTKEIFIPINEAIVQNIKEGEAMRRSTWDKNVDFILSGGNYGHFITKNAADKLR